MNGSSVDRLSLVCQELSAAGVVGRSTGTYPLSEATPAIACIPTPPTNRGVEIPKGVTQSLDYISGVYRGAIVEEVMELLAPGKEWENLGRGGYGRDNSWRCGHLKIYAGGEHAPYVQLASKALRQMETSGVVKCWRETLREWKVLLFKCTRVDWAWDDRDGMLDLPEIYRKLEARELTSRAVKFSRIEGGRMGRGERRGQTIYLGSRQSETLVRFYDKSAEQNVEGHWNRLEMELKDERAYAAVETWLDAGDSVWTGMLRAHLQFREITDRKRVDREAVSPWWDAFLGAALLVRLSIHRTVKRLEEVVAWVQKSVGPSLAMLFEWAGRDPEVLIEMCAGGKARWGPRHRWILQEWAT